MNLETRLDRHISKHPRQFRKDSVERVREFVHCEYKHPEKPKPYRFFESIEDFMLYKNLHPEWNDYSTTDMDKNESPGASSYYDNLLRWACKQTDDPVKRRALIQEIFPARFTDHSSFETIDDWLVEFRRHKEWRGYSTKDMNNNESPGARSFYQAFSRWVRKQADDVVERRELMKCIFPARYKYYSSFRTIDGWVAEFKRHKEWCGYSTRDMKMDKESGANAFYRGLSKWVHKQTDDPAERRTCVQRLFPARLRGYSSQNTIDDWVAEFKRHKEWRGYSTKDMQMDKESGACAFYQGLSKWVHKQTDEPVKRRKLVRRLFRERAAPFPYSTRKEIVYFGSRPERIVGLLLNQYGLLKQFKEGENVHIRTNGHKTHNLDFLFGNTFIEYHPFGIGEHKNGMKDIGAVARKRIGNITNPAFKDYKFYMVTDVKQVYDLLHMPEIRRLVDPEMKPLSLEQFNEELRHAYARAGSYDNKHTELFKN